MSQPDFLVHDEVDNVGVIVKEGITKGQELSGLIMENGKTMKVTAQADIPLGHKVALKDLSVDELVIKYSGNIGHITESVGLGGHVHVHNTKTNRW